MDRYKSWKERTTTSPSERHLDHYHALFRPFKYDNNGEKESIKEKQESTIQVHFMML